MIEWGIVKTILSGAANIFGFLIKKLRRPKIETPRAPANIFEHIKPYASISRIKEILGNPCREENNTQYFRFKDALVQVVYDGIDTIQSVSVTLPAMSLWARFPVPPTKFILGKTTVADFWSDELTWTKDGSSKYTLYSIERYFGYPGNYWHYTFGLYEGPGVSMPQFEWDYKNHCLTSDPKNVKFNWVTIACDEGAGGINNPFVFL